MIKQDNRALQRWIELRKYVCVPDHYRGKTVPWINYGEEEQFNALGKDHAEKWPNPYELPFYTTNKFGLRHPHEITEAIPNSIAFLGCSITFGIGMSRERLWSTMVAEELDMTPINMAQPGGGWDSAFRLYSEWQPIAKCPYTIIYFPDFARRDFALTDLDAPPETTKTKLYGHWDIKNEKSFDVKRFLLEQVFSPGSNWENRYRNIVAIQKIANDTGSKVLILRHSDFSTNSISLDNVFDFARDGSHPGLLWNIAMKNHALEKFREGKWKN